MGLDENNKTGFHSVEGLDDDAAGEVIIASLEQVPNRDSNTITGSPFKSINDMIDHIRRKTPEGLHVIGLYRRAEQSAKEYEQKRRESSVPFRLRKLARDAIAKIRG